MGCLRADGRERLLDTGGDFFEFSSTVDQVELAGPYAGVVISGGGKCGGFGSVELFDLRTGAQVPNRGGEGTPCGMSVVLTIDQLVLGSDAVSAVHMTQGCYMCGTPSEEMIQASDRTGVHTLDSINEPSGTPPALTDLTLTGDTLTWEHNGSPRSAQLQP
jgi:hypothetical protein